MQARQRLLRCVARTSNIGGLATCDDFVRTMSTKQCNASWYLMCALRRACKAQAVLLRWYEASDEQRPVHKRARSGSPCHHVHKALPISRTSQRTAHTEHNSGGSDYSGDMRTRHAGTRSRSGSPDGAPMCGHCPPQHHGTRTAGADEEPPCIAYI